MRLLYHGPSLLAPDVPIFVAATDDSVNTKTGPMTQVWILRADQHPVGAVKEHTDAAICGDCRHRGADGQTRTCYVNVAWAPAAVYRAFLAGRYDDWRSNLRGALSGQPVRVGAYGDPAAVRAEFWCVALKEVDDWTGYTHQWRTCDTLLQRFFMASVDSLAEKAEAHDRGWRTFRVRTETSPLVASTPFEISRGLVRGEITCPASAEAGHRTTCDRCLLCNGDRGWAHRPDRRKSIAILAHGADAAFEAQQQGALPFLE